MAKGDIKISKLRNLPTTNNITSLGAIDVTSSSSYPDGYAIISKDAPNHRLYILNRSSTDTPDNDQFVPSNVSGVVWERIMGTQIATNDLRGTFDITTNPAQYPKGLASSAVNATQVGNGSGASNTIKGGDFWYVIDNAAGTNTIGPSAKPILTNNAIILALVDNATNLDSNWIILEASAGSDLAPHIASLRTLGTGAQQAAPGNDPRFADARVPLAHAPTHKHGGTDEIATTTPAAFEIPKADSTGKLDAWITGASESTAGKMEIATQVETDGGIDDSRAITPLKLATNPRLPSQTENDALIGTVGTPSSSNKFVTDLDPRLTNARTPIGTALTSGQFWVGSVGNVAAAVAASGDVSLSNAGVFTIPVSFITGKTAIAADGADYILVSDTSDSGNFKKVLISSLPTGSGTSSLTNGFLFVGNASNIATGVALSGDATITNTGILTVGANKISNSKLRLSTGLSIMGRSAATNGEVGDIVATAEGQVLQVKAGVLVFDSIAGGSPYPITTKGDLWTYSTVQARLPVGANGTILTADSAETTGIKWSDTFTGDVVQSYASGTDIHTLDANGYTMSYVDGPDYATTTIDWTGFTVDTNGEQLALTVGSSTNQIAHHHPGLADITLSFLENFSGATKTINIPARDGTLSLLEPVTILTDAATITWNGLTQGKNTKVTLGGNRTLGAISSPQDGEIYTIDVIQDATGGRTLAWNTLYKFPTGFDTGLNSGANAHTTFGFRFHASRMEYIFGGKLGADLIGSYVPLAGGTMTGDLLFTNTNPDLVGMSINIGSIDDLTLGIIIDDGGDLFTQINANGVYIRNVSSSDRGVLIDDSRINWFKTVSGGGTALVNLIQSNSQPASNITITLPSITGTLLAATTTSYTHDSAANTAGIPLGGAYNSNGVLRMRTGTSTTSLASSMGAVAKAGDTMTGDLLIDDSFLYIYDNTNEYYTEISGGSAYLYESGGTGLTVQTTGLVAESGSGFHLSLLFSAVTGSHKTITLPAQAGNVMVATTTSYAHDSAASAAGVPIGGAYNSGGALRIRTGSSSTPSVYVPITGSTAMSGVHRITGGVFQVQASGGNPNSQLSYSGLQLVNDLGSNTLTTLYTDEYMSFSNNLEGFYTHTLRVLPTFGEEGDETTHYIEFPYKSGTIALIEDLSLTDYQAEVISLNGLNTSPTATTTIGSWDEFGTGAEAGSVFIGSNVVNIAPYTSLNVSAPNIALQSSVSAALSGPTGTLAFGEDKITINSTTTGLEYTADYSASYTNRSLVDKGFVISSVGGKVSKAGDTMTGDLLLTNNHAVFSSGSNGEAYFGTGGVMIEGPAENSLEMGFEYIAYVDPVAGVNTSINFPTAGGIEIANLGASSIIKLDPVDQSIQVFASVDQFTYMNFESFQTYDIARGSTAYFGGGIERTFMNGSNLRINYTTAGVALSIATVDWLFQSGKVMVATTTSYANDAAAATGGVPVGGAYHTSGTLKIRLV